ncbi:MAG: heparin lyase I family protein [Rubrobacter sp.]
MIAILGVAVVAALLVVPIPFEDTFDRETNLFTPSWDLTLQQESGRITTSSKRARDGTHSARFAVFDSDDPNSWGTRADLVSRSMFCEGDEQYIGWSVLFPSNFLDRLSSNGWLMVAEDGYSGYNAPPIAYYFFGGPDGGKFEILARPDGGRAGNHILSVDPTYGQWMDVVTRYKFSSDSAEGFIEVWINGQSQTFSDGSQRYYQNTLEPGATDCGHLIHNHYRAAGMAESLTIYQDEIKVGDSYSAVAP